MIDVSSCLSLSTIENQKNGGFDDGCITTVNLFYPPGGSPDVTGYSIVAANVVSIEFRARLLLVDSSLQTFICVISCSVFVSDSS
ncbi:MAG TPA: hypothetical protein VFR94_21935 [Nitrososphaeraceae archaeon]|nr:hypothetical protein [Nitrososphaeraceae archaeon]